MNDFDIGSIMGDPDGGGTSPSSIDVISPSGNSFSVLNQAEADFYDQRSQRYQADNSFSNVSDLAELDRILMMELMCHRWSQWIIMETDYNGAMIDPSAIQKYIEVYSKEIRGCKRDLGMDKSSRDKDNESSVADYLQNLRLRAHEFGVHRNNQVIAAITFLKELQGKMTLSENSTEAERREFESNRDQVWEWCMREFEKFDEIDEAFSKEQRAWVRDI